MFAAFVKSFLCIAKRADMVNAFQAEELDTHLFLISLKAGNTGLTLTAADYVFLFDPWRSSDFLLSCRLLGDSSGIKVPAIKHISIF